MKKVEAISVGIVMILFLAFIINMWIEHVPEELNIKKFGGRHEKCYPNKTCRNKLTCQDQICVKDK